MGDCRWHLRRRGGALTAAALVGVIVAGCGDDDDDATPTTEVTDDGSGMEADGGAGSTLGFTAVDIDFEREEVSASPGDLDVTLTNEGAIEHSWVVEGHEAELRLYTQQSGATDQGTITLDQGTYTYYCDIPGHRAAGMEGTLRLE
jgi:plastocyanin